MDIKKCKYKIVVDSREKVNNHILNRFEEGFEYKVSHHDMYVGKKSTYSDPVNYYIQEKGLKTGDYTIAIQLPNKDVLNFQDKIVIERKADLNELCSNLFDSKSKDEEIILCLNYDGMYGINNINRVMQSNNKNKGNKYKFKSRKSLLV